MKNPYKKALESKKGGENGKKMSRTMRMVIKMHSPKYEKLSNSRMAETAKMFNSPEHKKAVAEGKAQEEYEKKHSIY